MVKYYDKRIGEIIDTVTEIPTDLLEKKDFLLPVEVMVDDVEEGTIPDRESGVYVFDDRVELVEVNFYHVDTLEEVKVKKINSLKTYIQPKFPPYYKQLNSLFSIYSEVENQEILDSVKQWRDYINGFEDSINACTTIDEVKNIDFRTAEDIQNNVYII